MPSHLAQGDHKELKMHFHLRELISRKNMILRYNSARALLFKWWMKVSQLNIECQVDQKELKVHFHLRELIILECPCQRKILISNCTLHVLLFCLRKQFSNIRNWMHLHPSLLPGRSAISLNPLILRKYEPYILWHMGFFTTYL